MVEGRLWGVGALAVAGLMLSGCGDDDKPAAPPTTTERVINVVMVDNQFQPSKVQVDAGQRVRLVFENTGTVDHEAVVGDEAMQEAHEADAAHEAMHHGSGSADQPDDSSAITVKPGETGEIVYVADRAGTMIIGCHEPGHYADGMAMTISVS